MKQENRGDPNKCLIPYLIPTELLSRSDIHRLEDCLPDELVSPSWEELLGGNKPPAQGPGPGQGQQQQHQMNGGDDNNGGGGANVVVVQPNVNMQRAMQQQQQQQLVHQLLQQQQQQQHGNKNQMVPMGMGSKSPNLQAPNSNAVQSSLANSLGGPMGNSMVMSIASNGNQQPMSSMQGKSSYTLSLSTGGWGGEVADVPHWNSVVIRAPLSLQQ